MYKRQVEALVSLSVFGDLQPSPSRGESHGTLVGFSVETGRGAAFGFFADSVRSAFLGRVGDGPGFCSSGRLSLIHI